MPNITLLTTLSTVTNATTFVIVDNALTRRFTFASLRNQLASELSSSAVFKGAPGTPGTPGTNGQGVPVGGNARQVLAKVDYSDYNTTWINNAAISTSGAYSQLVGAPPSYSATSINSFIDVNTTGTYAPINGQALLWNSNANEWQPASIGTGLGLTSRTTVNAATPTSLSVNVSGDCQVVGFRSYLLSKVVTNYPAWVRIYSDINSRAADSTRTEGTDPLPGKGVIAEVITTAGSLTQLITPGVFASNSDSITTTTIYLSVTNKHTAPITINVSLTILQLEA
jgi:hypothetical protein